MTSATLPVRLAARTASLISRAADWATSRLPYFPDPRARCSAHGTAYCAACHRNPSGSRTCGQCFSYDATGMHGDTCQNRIR